MLYNPEDLTVYIVYAVIIILFFSVLFFNKWIDKRFKLYDKWGDANG